MFRRKKPLPAATIGICSLQHNAGVTCFSLACANYLCSYKNEPTACVECNRTHTFVRLSAGKEEPFCIQGISLYTDQTLLSSGEQKGYTFVVKDFGVLSQEYRTEFLHCDLRLLILDLSCWKQGLSEELFVKTFGSGSRREPITLLGNPGPIHGLSSSSPLSSYPLIPLSFIKNPFHLTPDDFGVFEKVLKELIYHR